jgi:hypothetical protein
MIKEMVELSGTRIFSHFLTLEDLGKLNCRKLQAIVSPKNNAT